MDLAARSTRQVSWGWILLIILPCLSCTKMSDSIEDRSVGMNGGFEHTQSGLPVNWLVGPPSTTPTCDYDLIFDRTDFKEGRQSLRFLVRECSQRGYGRAAVGIAKEYAAIPGESYAVSFWIKNEGSEYRVRVGGVGIKTGEYETVDSSDESADSWKRVEYTYAMPQKYERIRFELSTFSPGSLWVDDIRIAHIDGESGTLRTVEPFYR